MAIVSDTIFGPVKLERHGDLLVTDVDGEISFKGVVFGGWTASLAALAAAEGLGGAVLSAAHVLFSGPVRPGRIELRVEDLRTGGSLTARRVRVTQGGGTLVSLQAWFCLPDLLGEAVTDGTPQASPPPPLPEDCPTLEWFWTDVPFLRHIDERGIDYPESVETFRDGPPRVELWARPADREARLSPLARQLFDLVLFDAHLLDSAYRATDLTAVHILSLDLCVTWAAVPPIGWTRLRADAITGPAIMATTGTARDGRGTAYAVATSQGRVRGSVRGSV
ncbi:thioesterase family protein [Planotetraspora sp. A-T 1434]|uniref:thioesterase family protein n=1 Tax=Planotetraspora sp. A-T 1434 TaxID=2979219 RepID=UPI0021C235E5|nr:thioesterase family protein [Planotetraspora sp. A-T 1434]MCT9933638.1 thioesterase family protein [Planotetraspora sp. A-T 1434]